jgi:hypothetical protein
MQAFTELDVANQAVFHQDTICGFRSRHFQADLSSTVLDDGIEFDNQFVPETKRV